MDVSNLLASSSSQARSTEVVNENIQVDAGLLAVFDVSQIDEDSYRENPEEYLQSTARTGVQALINSLFSLPIQKSVDGPLALLPTITTLLPRSKPLPKPKPPTKWEQFANAKGIQKKIRDRKIWDEERQEWVNRWGRAGKNKEIEEQWATEVPANAPNDYDPSKEAREVRKSRMAKNEKQRIANIARAQGSSATALKEEKKGILTKQIAQTRISTASMGKFDRKLEGEPKLRGIKRKFEANEVSGSEERQAALAIAAKLDGSAPKKARRDSGPSTSADGEPLVNVRKAVRHVTGGRGGAAFGRERERAGKSGGKKGRTAMPKGKGKR